MPGQNSYGEAHRKLRRRVARVVEAGGALCTRCGERIEPGSPWDLGHDDVDRSRYSGPEHRGCNRATFRRPLREVVTSEVGGLVTSREW